MSNKDVMDVWELPSPIHTPYGTVAVGMRGIAGMITMSLRKYPMDATSEVAKVVKKGEIVLDASDATEQSHLLSNAVSFQEAFLQTMKIVRCVWNENLPNPNDTH